MAILKSVVVEDRAQPDGRRSITERHERDDGPAILVSYVAEKGDDVDAAMTARVALLEAGLAEEKAAASAGLIQIATVAKITAYNNSLSDLVLKTTAKLTVDEIAAFRAGLK